MPQIKLTPEQADQFRAGEAVEICDPQGRVLAHVSPTEDPELIAVAKRRTTSPGPWYSGDEVQSQLHQLQQTWDQEGGFDEKRMHELLKRDRVPNPE